MVVERFELRSPPLLDKEQHGHHLDGWFGFIASTRAKHVTLDFSPPINSKNVASPIKCSNQLVDNTSSCWTVGIVSLILGYVRLELPTVSNNGRSPLVGFKTLKKLELKFVVDLGGLTPLIANCPALEWLGISNSSIPHIVVPHQARCLRYLRLERVGFQSIHLNATSLTTFDYLGSASVRIKTRSALKLSQANILFYWALDLDTVGYFWDELSCSLAHVHHLVLRFNMDTESTRSIKNPTRFIHLRRLVLFCNIFGDPESALVVLRLTQILESAPQLEHFVLHMDSFDVRPLYLKTPTCIHPHVHRHLKTVQMTGVFGLSGQLELAKYIMLSAEVLEFMTLNLARNQKLQLLASNYTYFTELEKFAKKYLDPQGVYHCVLKIVGLNLNCH